jgi:NAD(P)-dependent dehydrogenase (short-subunit alcohol dehydrogenase family)
MKKTALITGANRGIGFEVCRQLGQKSWQVILTARDETKGQEAVSRLKKEGLSVAFLPLEVTDEDSIKSAAKMFEKGFGTLDALINNAGGNYDYGVTPTQSKPAFIRGTIELNLISAWLVTQAFLPFLLKSQSARIVNVASGAGSHADPHFGLAINHGTVASYGISKLALNGLTVKLAEELKSKGVLVNSVCPGFTATYPGAETQGARPVEDGAAGVVWAATLENDGPTGGFFRDGKPIGW